TRVTIVGARRVGVLDHPGPRTFHTVATPRLGGIGIIAGVSLPMLALLFFPPFREVFAVNREPLIGLLIAGVLIIGLGIYDDLFGANAWEKFLFQTMAAAVLVQFGFVFDKLSLLGFTFDLNGLAWLATIVWIVGIINAVNFIDGMDGLAATISLTLAAIFAIISLLEGNFLTLILMVALAGSLAGFLPFNRRPARIFMGDTGSMFLGLLLASMTVAGNTKTPASIALAGPMLALALPVLDTMFVIRGRFFAPGLKLGERVFRMFNADRNHFHHRLYAHFGSEAKVVGTLWLLTVLFGVAAIMTVISSTVVIGKVLAAGTVVLVLVLRMVSAKVAHSEEPPESISRVEKRWSNGSMFSFELAPAGSEADRRSSISDVLARDLRSFIMPHGFEPDQGESVAPYVEESAERELAVQSETSEASTTGAEESSSR
ncbi:MAG TPA: MraY family glycosyltransferase, partial [Thermoanaerobaculia bacterium]|nr:MraY family glycosyltransferase [Thermoanaerobaculia bacterium]